MPSGVAQKKAPPGHVDYNCADSADLAKTLKRIPLDRVLQPAEGQLTGSLSTISLALAYRQFAGRLLSSPGMGLGSPQVPQIRPPFYLRTSGL
jgi:hypothetical protein